MVGMTMTSTTVGTTIASTTAGITMAATVITGHINHGHDKHSREIPKAGLYLYFACLYDHYYYCATRATKTNYCTYNSRSRSQREPASNQSKLRISLLILYPSYGIFCIFR